MNHEFYYLAGYIDGDGCIYCRTYPMKSKNKNILVYESSLQICSVDESICKFFTEKFGGTFAKKPEQQGNRRQAFLWYIKGNLCRELLLKTKENLVLKKKSADLCCHLIENVNSTVCFIGKPVDKHTHEYRKTLIDKIKEHIHMHDLIDENIFKDFKNIKKIKSPSIADYAYLAGLIDAEGCFRIQHWQPKRPGRNIHWVITLEIGNTKSSIFPWLMERFGGSIVYRKPKARCNPMIIWSLRSDALFQVLPNIYPFLKSKKERCEKITEFHQISFENGGNRKSEEFKRKSLEILEIRKKLFEQFSALNAKGKH